MNESIVVESNDACTIFTVQVSKSPNDLTILVFIEIPATDWATSKSRTLVAENKPKIANIQIQPLPARTESILHACIILHFFHYTQKNPRSRREKSKSQKG